MSAKFSRTLTIIALAVLAVSTAFVLALLFMGTLSQATKDTTGVNEGVAVGCTGVFLVIAFLFGAVIKFLSIIFGVSSIFVKRKISAVLILGVLTCILAIVSLICSIYCLSLFQTIQNGSSHANLMNIGLISSVVSDAFWFISIIINTIAISKMVKTMNSENTSEGENT